MSATSATQRAPFDHMAALQQFLQPSNPSTIAQITQVAHAIFGLTDFNYLPDIVITDSEGTRKLDKLSVKFSPVSWGFDPTQCLVLVFYIPGTPSIERKASRPETIKVVIGNDKTGRSNLRREPFPLSKDPAVLCTELQILKEHGVWRMFPQPISCEDLPPLSQLWREARGGGKGLGKIHALC